MVNSKGGFLVEDDKEVDDVQKAKEKERERQRAVQNLDPRTYDPFHFRYYSKCRSLIFDCAFARARSGLFGEREESEVHRVWVYRP